MSLYIDPSLWSLRTKNGIPYKLLEGYPQGSYEEENATVTEKYIIRQVDFDQFIHDSFSDMEHVYPGGTWRYTPARAFGEDTFVNKVLKSVNFNPTLVTTKVSFEPFPNDKPCDINNIFKFGMSVDNYVDTYTQFLQLTIEYSAGKATEDHEDLLEGTDNATGEFLLVPSSKKMNWDFNVGGKVADKRPVLNLNVPITQILPGIEWSVKYRRVMWNNLPGVITLCQTNLGCVNSKPMPIFRGKDGDPVETFLFVGFSWTTRRTWRDQYPMAELEMKLLEKSVGNSNGGQFIGGFGHNYFMNPDTGTWMVLLKADDSKMYFAKDLNTLFFGGNLNP